MADITTKAGDSPKIRARLSYVGGAFLDLNTVKTVVVKARKTNGVLVLDNAACTPVVPLVDGRVEFARPAVPGTMRVEFLVTFNDDSTRTFPDPGYEILELLPRLS